MSGERLPTNNEVDSYSLEAERDRINELMINPRITKLIVDQQVGTALNAGTGVRFYVRILGFLRRQYLRGFSYYSLSDLSGTNELRVLMNTDQGLKNIYLPEGMLSRMAEFIRQEPKYLEKSFDCGSFAHFINGVPYESAKFIPEKWDIEYLSDENVLEPGDTIFIAETKNLNNFPIRNITHFAIYLGDGLYISKFGQSGRLIVANLEEMKKGFGGNHAFQAKPRHN